MTYYSISQWRLVCLIHCSDLDVHFIHDIFGPTPRTFFQWYNLFKTKGAVDAQQEKQKSLRWPEEVLQAVANYCKNHPTFYLKELQDFLTKKFDLKNISLSTTYRALYFN